VLTTLSLLAVGSQSSGVSAGGSSDTSPPLKAFSEESSPESRSTPPMHHSHRHHHHHGLRSGQKPQSASGNRRLPNGQSTESLESLSDGSGGGGGGGGHHRRKHNNNNSRISSSVTPQRLVRGRKSPWTSNNCLHFSVPMLAHCVVVARCTTARRTTTTS